MWQSIQCVMQGKGHLKENLPCQDKTFFIQKNNVYVITLADGAGSANYSEIGAEIITKEMSIYLSENFEYLFDTEDGVLVKNILIEEIDKIIQNKSSEIGCNPKELASTFLAVAVKGSVFLILHIGDGVIGYRKNDKMLVASKPDNGEYSNFTTFTTSENKMYSLRIFKGKINDISGFILMSDGAAESFYDKNSQSFAKAVNRIINITRFSEPAILEKVIRNNFIKNIIGRTSDDCSFILLSKKTDDFNCYLELSFDKKASFLRKKNISSQKKKIRELDKILKVFSNEKTIEELHKATKIAPRTLEAHINYLKKLDYIQNYNGGLISIVKMI